MPDQTDTKLPLTTETPVEGRKDALKELFPEAFSEDKVDFDKLRQALGDEAAMGRERYGLSWAGKADAVRAVQIPSVGTLIPDRDESVAFDSTENLFIEGDNLEVLKLLQKSYYGKVKMIYIDPPYNTGHDFIYPDNFKKGLDGYLRYTGQIDSDGIRYSTNTETGGRFHSSWLSMMYSRLFIAKQLLQDCGVIIVSIDDGELANLVLMMDELFGEENRLAIIAWEKRFTRSNNARLFASVKDSLVIYRRNIELESLREARSEKADSIYANPDNDPRGDWTSVSYVNPATKEKRPKLVYKIHNPFTGEEVEHPTNAWKFSPKQHMKHVDENKLYWGKEGTNKYPRLKKFLVEVSGGMVPIDIWHHNDSGTTDEGTKELEALMGEKVFDNPKPIRLIKRMLKLITETDNQDIILDFFSGSCSSANAVLDLNREDAGNRRFIMVQLPEPTPDKSEAHKAGYKTIADIGKERIRRVIKKLKEDDEGKLAFGEREQPEDLGFRVYKLGASNFKIWQADDAPTDEDALADQLKLFADHVLEGRSEEAVLYELILKSGLPLTAKVEEKRAAGKKVYLVGEEENRLAICLEKEVTREALRAMMDFNPIRVLCLDKAFAGNDQLKTNTVLEMKSHEIEFRTV